MCKGEAKVQLNTGATPGLIKQAKPDVLIVAVGSEYIVPLIPGKDKSLVVVARDVLLGQKTVGAKVVVIGGGIVGCETALYVGEELKKKVTIIARRHDILVGIENLSKIALTERLQKVGVEIYCGWELKEITDGGVVCEDRDWQRHEVAADTVIIAKGLESRKEMVEKFTGLASEVHVIGDCADARKIYNAFEDAWRTALML